MSPTAERWLPGVATARSYRREWLVPDLTAGAVLSALLVPAGMGYAQAAGLPPETGLYATIAPLLAYALVGPSRILVLGPDSALAPLIAAAVLPLAAGDPDRAVALAGVLALLVGAVLLVGGLVRLGGVTELLSAPIRNGYLNGIAVVVIVSQVPDLLGFAIDGGSLLEDVRATAAAIADGAVDPLAAALGAGSLAVILVPRLLGSRVPGILVAVVGATVLVAVAGWDGDVPVAGDIPAGLPGAGLGSIGAGDLGALVGPAVGIALIAFTDTAVLSRTFAARHGTRVDGNQEMRAIGAANVAAGLVGGFPISGSSSRTPVAERSGARTQLTGVVGALLLVVFIVVGRDVTGFLPQATLAAVVIVAAGSLIDVPGTLRLLRANRMEGLLSIAAFVGVATVGVLWGIVVAIGLSVLAFVDQARRPYRAELGLVPGRRGYHDLARNPEGERIPGLAIVRFDAPLFFANATLFHDFVHGVVEARDDVRTVVVAAEPITGVDTTAYDSLVDLDEDLSARGVRLVFAEMKGPVKDAMARYGTPDRFGGDRFWPTVGTVVDSVTGRLRSDIGDPHPDRSGEGPEESGEAPPRT